MILDYGRELGAGPSGPGYVSQALRLWAASGLGETSFVGLLHTARRQVRGGSHWPHAMPQFFAIVQMLLAGTSPAAPQKGVS